MITLNVKKTLPWLVYLIFFAVLNETVFNVSTPAIQADYHLSPTGVSWMMTTFIIFFGVGSVVYGRLSDLFSLKRLIQIGILLYVAGSLVAFIGQVNYLVVLLGRALQGMGGAAIPALIMVIVARYFAPEVRGQLFGSIGSVIAIALGIGPVLGGFVAGTFHWTWLLLVPLATIVGFPFLGRVLPDEPRRPGHVDVWGALAMTVGVGALMIGLTSPHWIWFVTAAVFLGALLVRMQHAQEPFIQPDLFQNKGFRRGVAATLFLFGAFIGILFVLPLILTRLQHMSASEIGLVLFPGAISGVIFGPVGGRMADKKGNRFVMFMGLVLVGLGLSVAAFFLESSLVVLALLLLPTYVGFSFLQTGLINSVSQTLPEGETGVGMGVFNLVGILAGAVGTAIVAKILEAHWLTESGIVLVFTALTVLAALWYALTLKPFASKIVQA